MRKADTWGAQVRLQCPELPGPAQLLPFLLRLNRLCRSTVTPLYRPKNRGSEWAAARWPRTWPLDVESGHEAPSSAGRTPGHTAPGPPSGTAHGPQGPTPVPEPGPWVSAPGGLEGQQPCPRSLGAACSPSPSLRQGPWGQRGSGGRLGPALLRTICPAPGRAGATVTHCHRALQPRSHLSSSLTVPLGALKVNMLI